MESKFINLKKILPVGALLLVSCFYGQVRIANSATNQAAINSSAFIDASSNTTFNQSPTVGKGLLYPRTDLTVFNGFSGVPVGTPNSYPYNYDGFMVFNTAASGTAGVGATEGTLCRGFWYYDNPSTNLTGGTWKPLRPDVCSPTTPPVITGLTCSGATDAGTLTEGIAASGVSSQIPYTGGNGGSYSAQSISSTGVTGLTATLVAGTLANGNGTLTYNITGTPSSSGTASFAISIGGQSCTFTRTVVGSGGGGPVITSLSCSAAVNTGTLTEGIAASSVSSLIPYTGGNGVSFPASTVIPSTGVTGLFAQIQADTLLNGDGNLNIHIVGTPTGSGVASFTITFGGQTCTLTRIVESGYTVVMCGSSQAWYRFNMGANATLDVDVPSQDIVGGYYQWGRRAHVADAYNLGAISGWNTSDSIPDNSWNLGTEGSPIKDELNDPCPTGYRVPTATEFQTLLSNNVESRIGTWSSGVDDFTNFSAAVVFTCPSTGKKITFPAAGYRATHEHPGIEGRVVGLGSAAMYFTSSPFNAYAYSLFQPTGSTSSNIFHALFRSNASPIRCISE
ncbi:hypothetical protein D1631_06195 [Chryseobacterium nematophagum]|uniref:Fibrobacter succinogenes major paralogous domain-containing protein n=1 Tax=Chryseobacterium nematophagum TaxID=2305228 RepID=A0A3M7TFY7_9FLAO|nr:hypothetical protein [Chryseobacterium nematophagum]RNA61549.1 hypothetical protein D1631_06195 [Chryseobacterium nematophagum]